MQNTIERLETRVAKLERLVRELLRDKAERDYGLIDAIEATIDQVPPGI